MPELKHFEGNNRVNAKDDTYLAKLAITALYSELRLSFSPHPYCVC